MSGGRAAADRHPPASRTGGLASFTGSLGTVSAPQLGEASGRCWVRNGPGALVLDLRGISFLDSTGLKAIFLAVRNEARERGQQFAVTPGSPQVQRLLSLTRLGDHLTVIETPDAVLV